jgi:hypothetical protein
MSRWCHSCQAALNPNDRFCPSCGTAVSKLDSISRQGGGLHQGMTSLKARLSGWWFVIIAIAVTLLGFVAFGQSVAVSIADAGPPPTGAPDSVRGQYWGELVGRNLFWLAFPIVLWVLAVASCVGRNLVGCIIALSAMVVAVVI